MCFINLSCLDLLKSHNDKKCGLFEIADIMWHKSGRFDFMPIRMKIEFISGIVNENMKLGDRYQPQYFIDNKKMQCQILCFIFKMLTRKISGHILTIGCEYRHPKGGVAQVMYNYEKYVFPVFNCIVNSGGTNNVAKLLKAISGYLLMAIHLTTDSHLRIVHIHTSSYNSFKRSAYFVRLAKAFGRKVVLHIHGGDFKNITLQTRNGLLPC